MRKLRCTISGSFRKFLPDIKRVARRFERVGVEVLSPTSFAKKQELNGFVILTGDKGSPKAIEQDHLEAIQNSDFLYVVNPQGHVGPSVILEIGYAIAHAVPVFCSETPSEFVLRLFTRTERSLGGIKRTLTSSSLPPVPAGASVTELQSYVQSMVRIRGFEDESIQDVILLLVEEFGELAKEVRREVGLKIHVTKNSKRRRVSEELADCLIYLLDIANMLNIRLADALRWKEIANKRRRWVST